MPQYNLFSSSEGHDAGDAERIVESVREIENAGHTQQKLDQVLERFCKEIQDNLGFNFVAIQLKNKEDKTIETVYGTGLSSEWRFSP